MKEIAEPLFENISKVSKTSFHLPPEALNQAKGNIFRAGKTSAKTLPSSITKVSIVNENKLLTFWDQNNPLLYFKLP